ncbi:MAG: UDP-3-O-[3-hydroxymyristoyl] glucosamine N-acyltransferase [Flavobacteriales bacterium]
MKLERTHSLKEIAALIGCKFIGDPEHKVTGLNEIHVVNSGDIVFVDHPKYYSKALNSAASTILIDKVVDCPEGKALLISDNPFDDFNYLTKRFAPYRKWTLPRGENLIIGQNSIVHPNVVFGHDVKIGDNCMIHSGVVIGDNCTLGDNVVVQSNSVIGSDAFYYQKKDSGYNRLHTCGKVWLQDNVEIGALCSIDAGVTDITVIGKGSKLDNQVHIGHDTKVGSNCLMAAQVGVAGCVIIEDNVTLWGQVGVASDLTIGEGAVILGMSGVGKDLEGGKTYFGAPVSEARAKWKELAAIRQLPRIIENL